MSEKKQAIGRPVRDGIWTEPREVRFTIPGARMVDSVDGQLTVALPMHLEHVEIPTIVMRSEDGTTRDLSPIEGHLFEQHMNGLMKELVRLQLAALLRKID